MRKLMFLALALAVGLGLAAIPAAQAFQLEAVNNFSGGAWSNWTPPPPGLVPTLSTGAVGYGNTIENIIAWGGDAGAGQSALGFTGKAPPFTVFAAETPFELGQLRHFNNSVYQPWLTSVQLQIVTDFSNPVGTPNFIFTLGVLETPNDPNKTNHENRDFISFPSAFSDQSWTIGSTIYTLKLLGFGVDVDHIVLQFESDEGATNPILLWGKMTTEVVPLPGALFLFGSGLAGLAILRRWR